MSSYRKSRRNFERMIAEIDKRSADRVKTDKRDMIGFALNNDDFERNHLKMEIKVLEAERLHDIATKYGISSFPPHEIYDPQMKDVKPRPIFSEQSKAQLHKMISEARFNWWKKWMELLVPILALVVAILALLK